MNKLKRYDIEEKDLPDPSCEQKMILISKGDWVKYDDVKELEAKIESTDSRRLTPPIQEHRMDIDKLIRDLFERNWHGVHVLSSIDNMKAQLAKTLQDQIDGYWSGRTAYNIAVDGGFLKDAKTDEKKELTELGFVTPIPDHIDPEFSHGYLMYVNPEEGLGKMFLTNQTDR